MRADVEGRYLILEANIQDTPLYAPNTTTKQSSFFQSLSESISDEEHREVN